MMKVVNTLVSMYAFVTVYLSDVGFTSGRARSLVGAVLGLISLVIGGIALARVRSSTGRSSAIVAVVLGLLAVVLSVVHLSMATGGFGTGSGRAGAIVGLLLGLLGTTFGGLARARSQRS